MSLTPDASRGEVVVYVSTDGETRVDVRLERDMVWLTLDQIALLFDRHKSVVSRHLHNIFDTKELDRAATVARNATVHVEGGCEVGRNVEVFSLDAILAGGYRVNSWRGTQFRIRATRTLREHLLRGFTLHEQRLRERGLRDLEEAVDLLARTLPTADVVSDEGRAVLEVVQRHSRTWRWLAEYDEDRLRAAPDSRLAPVASTRIRSARRTCCTSWSRTIPSMTGTSASVRCSSSTVSAGTGCCFARTGSRDSPTPRSPR